MEQSVITGFLAVSVALLNPSSINHIEITSQEMPQQEMREYIVQEGDSLASIAEEVYGTSDYYTNLLKDNDFIKNPDLIEKGMVLKIRNIKPVIVENDNAKVSPAEIEENNPTPTTAVSISAGENTDSLITPTTQVSSTPTTQPVAQTSSSEPLNEAQINFLGNCEAGMNPTRNSGNGYYGAFQFSYGTWKSMGTAYERADLAPLEVQIDAVQRLVARSSIFTQFPACARKMQAEGLI